MMNGARSKASERRSFRAASAIAEACAPRGFRAYAETATVPGTGRKRRSTLRDAAERFLGFGGLTFPGFFTPTVPRSRAVSALDGLRPPQIAGATAR